MFSRKLEVVLTLVLLASSLAQAQEASTSKYSDWERRFIDSNIAVSEWFDGMAEGLDLFLVGQKITDRPNESQFKIENSTYSREGQAVRNVIGFGVNPRLPNLEEYWKLKFTSYDEREQRRGVRRGYLRQAPEEENYGATVGLFRRLGSVRTAFQPRVEFTNSLKISHSLTFESVADLGTFELNPKLEFFADPDKGTGIFAAFNVHYELDMIYSLTLINDIEYQDFIRKLSVANGVSLGQIVDDRSGLDYSLIFYSHNRENYHWDGTTASVAWSQSVYHKVFDYQVITYLNFFREDAYRGRAGATLRLILQF